jgi:hypothetical protein
MNPAAALDQQDQFAQLHEGNLSGHKPRREPRCSLSRQSPHGRGYEPGCVPRREASQGSERYRLHEHINRSSGSGCRRAASGLRREGERAAQDLGHPRHAPQLPWRAGKPAKAIRSLHPRSSTRLGKDHFQPCALSNLVVWRARHIRPDFVHMVWLPKWKMLHIVGICDEATPAPLCGIFRVRS